MSNSAVRRGRPKAENPRDQRIEIRLTAEEVAHLADLAHEAKQTVSAFVRERTGLSPEEKIHAENEAAE